MEIIILIVKLEVKSTEEVRSKRVGKKGEIAYLE